MSIILRGRYLLVNIKTATNSSSTFLCISQELVRIKVNFTKFQVYDHCLCALLQNVCTIDINNLLWCLCWFWAHLLARKYICKSYFAFLFAARNILCVECLMFPEKSCCAAHHVCFCYKTMFSGSFCMHDKVHKFVFTIIQLSNHCDAGFYWRQTQGCLCRCKTWDSISMSILKKFLFSLLQVTQIKYVEIKYSTYH